MRIFTNRQIYQYAASIDSITPQIMESYIEGIKHKIGSSCSIRLVFLGQEQTGKTTLMRRMSEQNPYNPESTNHLDVTMNAMLLDMNTGTRTLLSPGSELEVARQRLKTVTTQSGNIENHLTIIYK